MNVILKKGEDKRIKQGHLWIFSNEIDNHLTPLKSFKPGAEVTIQTHDGRPLGSAYINPNSLIAARLYSYDPQACMDENFFAKRLKTMVNFRDELYHSPFYRLCFGESDYLPGLTIDRFNDILSVQITTQGIEQRKQTLINALNSILKPKSILLRNDVPIRTLEGLELYSELHGEEFNDDILLEENALKFVIPLKQGQKTGWFYDQRDNRQLFSHYAKGKKVLDVFSYVGSFAVNAAASGAKEVTCIDSSSLATEYVGKNMKINGYSGISTIICEEANKALELLWSQSHRYDLISLDPPAFIKKKKDFEAGKRGYLKTLKLGLKLLTADGILMISSCSHHLSREDLLQIVHRASFENELNLQIIGQGHQAADHPIHPAMPETEYLKSFLIKVQGTRT